MGSAVASVSGTPKHMAGVGGLRDGRGSNTFAPPKLLLPEAPEERHPKALQTDLSWWVWLSFERFLAEPGAGFHCRVRFPGSLS